MHFYLALIGLKKLSLKGLDKMPKITDTLFSLVLSKMQLRELVLTSEEPVKKVMQPNSHFHFILDCYLVCVIQLVIFLC